MYVKLFNRILDSSIADNRRLRHFFIDLLLCADQEGNVLMTKQSISNRIRSSLEEVEWGLGELMRPDPDSFTSEHGGRRVIALEGLGYGWKIVNYEAYRDLKTARELRENTAERVRKHRAGKRIRNGKPQSGEMTHENLVRNGASEDECNRFTESTLPEHQDYDDRPIGPPD